MDLPGLAINPVLLIAAVIAALIVLAVIDRRR